MSLDGSLAFDACSGGGCDCTAKGLAPTSVHGTIYDPAGLTPLYNIFVYVPATTPAPIVAGSPTCSQCQAKATGSPIVSASTDAKGEFTLAGIPAGDGVPLVIQAGKWRRQVVLPHMNACQANEVKDPATLRLPKNGTEGDLPLIAFTTGGADFAECFLRGVGIDDSEFTTPSGTGHVHLYPGNGPSGLGGGAVAPGNTLTPLDTYSFWADSKNLLKYDIVFNSCEGSDYDRGPAAYGAMKQYLDGGGRLFATHYFYNWFAPPNGPSDFQSVAAWSPDPTATSAPYAGFFIDTSFPKGKAFADWLQNVGATTTYGAIGLVDTRADVGAVTSKATRWIYNADSPGSSTSATSYLSFNTPVTQPTTQQCGRAVFSDVHVAGGLAPFGAQTFPKECGGLPPAYAKNQTALEFLFFDLSSCVQDDTKPPPPPPPN